MTITREIDGKQYTIELTTSEINRAYYEAQKQFDIEDMTSYIEEYREWNEDIAEAEILENIQEIAEAYREMADQHEWTQTAQEAFDHVLR